MTSADTLNVLDFPLPPELEAAEPPEVRGLGRDGVRLMVSHRADDRIVHDHFTALPHHLMEGDVLAVNSSGTINASLLGRLPDGRALELHLSTHLPGDIWTVELRLPNGASTMPLHELHTPAVVRLPAGGEAEIHGRYYCGCHRDEPASTRLWTATLHLPDPILPYLNEYGRPIRYSYVAHPWPSAHYQTIFAREPGSAEMPSAGRAFTPRVLEALGKKGIILAPLVLHTGVASPEAHEPPYEEYFRVPEDTAAKINRARADGRRVIAVGTTVVRALETVASGGAVRAGEGWSCTVITPETGVHVIDGLLTGFHEPRASHLLMLEAIAGRSHLQRAYEAALSQRYLWHEFGDLHLIL